MIATYNKAAFQRNLTTMSKIGQAVLTYRRVCFKVLKRIAIHVGLTLRVAALSRERRQLTS